jgi:hypothetical protein
MYLIIFCIFVVIHLKDKITMSRFGDKIRAKFGQTPEQKESRQETRATKMEARKGAKAEKIKSKVSRGKITKSAGQRKTENLKRKTSNRSARIRKEKYRKGEGERVKVTKNPITGRTRTITKSRDKDGTKQKHVSIKQRKGAMNRHEIERKSKRKTGQVTKIKKKKKIDRYGYTEKTIDTRATKKGGLGNRKKTTERKRYRDDKSLTRAKKTIEYGMRDRKTGKRKTKRVVDIGDKGGYVDQYSKRA